MSTGVWTHTIKHYKCNCQDHHITYLLVLQHDVVFLAIYVMMSCASGLVGCINMRKGNVYEIQLMLMAYPTTTSRPCVGVTILFTNFISQCSKLLPLCHSIELIRSNIKVYAEVTWWIQTWPVKCSSMSGEEIFKMLWPNTALAHAWWQSWLLLPIIGVAPTLGLGSHDIFLQSGHSPCFVQMLA